MSSLRMSGVGHLPPEQKLKRGEVLLQYTRVLLPPDYTQHVPFNKQQVKTLKADLSWSFTKLMKKIHKHDGGARVPQHVRELLWQVEKEARRKNAEVEAARKAFKDRFTGVKGLTRFGHESAKKADGPRDDDSDDSDDDDKSDYATDNEDAPPPPPPSPPAVPAPEPDHPQGHDQLDEEAQPGEAAEEAEEEPEEEAEEVPQVQQAEDIDREEEHAPVDSGEQVEHIAEPSGEAASTDEPTVSESDPSAVADEADEAVEDEVVQEEAQAPEESTVGVEVESSPSEQVANLDGPAADAFDAALMPADHEPLGDTADSTATPNKSRPTTATEASDQPAVLAEATTSTLPVSNPVRRRSPVADASEPQPVVADAAELHEELVEEHPAEASAEVEAEPEPEADTEAEAEVAAVNTRPPSAATGSRPTSAAQPIVAQSGSRPSTGTERVLGSRPPSSAGERVLGSRPTSTSGKRMVKVVSRPTSAVPSRPASVAESSRPTSVAAVRSLEENKQPEDMLGEEEEKGATPDAPEHLLSNGFHDFDAIRADQAVNPYGGFLRRTIAAEEVDDGSTPAIIAGTVLVDDDEEEEVPPAPEEEVEREEPRPYGFLPFLKISRNGITKEVRIPGFGDKYIDPPLGWLREKYRFAAPAGVHAFVTLHAYGYTVYTKNNIRF